MSEINLKVWERVSLVKLAKHELARAIVPKIESAFSRGETEGLDFLDELVGCTDENNYKKAQESTEWDAEICEVKKIYEHNLKHIKIIHKFFLKLIRESNTKINNKEMRIRTGVDPYATSRRTGDYGACYYRKNIELIYEVECWNKNHNRIAYRYSEYKHLFWINFKQSLSSFDRQKFETFYDLFDYMIENMFEPTRYGKGKRNPLISIFGIPSAEAYKAEFRKFVNKEM